ncbi:hypothetical protein BDP27DRAFT_87069 [Rhodocollybia butyracea]|uniref:F-box domain-containing protein n=1 Tax=Rhodocollybia butyracea TaxID=206335 RepID=A0A9P5UD60_9AGAR|nr:hypothetical protein BDP27DRAFT_87069 [Rhodocollybia butyracea]
MASGARRDTPRGAAHWQTNRPAPAGNGAVATQRPVYRHITMEEYIRHTIERDPWVPHPLTPEEVFELRLDCARHFDEFRMIEANKAGKSREEYQVHCYRAFIAYQLSYWRTFRLNDLPMEIISNILRFVVWSAPTPPIGIRWRLQLTWVSKSLRHAAISDPTLWNAIWFRDDPPFERSLAFVERSGVSPLDLRINDTDEHKYTDEEVCNLLNALTPHLHHIRMLIILLDNWEPILSVLKWLNDYGKYGSPPLTMERFEIHRTGNPYLWPGLTWRGNRYDPPNHDVTFYPLFGGRLVPTLKSFTMNGVHIDWANTPSLNNLSTLDIRRIPLDWCPSLPRFREILTSSAMLTKLSLDGAGPASSNPTVFTMHPPIELPLLNTLVLANFAAPFTKSVVSHFTAPHVRDLTIMNFKGESYGPFYEFITGRFREIKLLTLYTTTCEVENLPIMIKWLDSMPLLTYARLASLDCDILQAFLFDPDVMQPHPLLPPQMRQAFRVVENLRLKDAMQPSKAILEDKDRQPRLVNPRLTVLEVQNIHPEIFTRFVGARHMCGVPVRKTYMARTMIEKFTQQTLAYARATVGQVMVIDIGTKTQEEDELLSAPNEAPP